MDIRRSTFWLGILFLVLGIVGFIPGFISPILTTDPTVNITTGYGRLFGIIPVNLLHNLVHLGFGWWGVVAANDFVSSRMYCRAMAVVLAIFAVMGIFPVLNTTFGLMPLYGGAAILHALLAVAAGYYGYVWVSRYDRTDTNTKAAAR